MKSTGSRVQIARTSGARLGSTGSLATATIGDGRRWPTILTILALLAALVAVPLIVSSSIAPAALADYRLEGYRAPGCIRFVVLRDQSGSMSTFADAREKTTDQLVRWIATPDVLRDDDELAVIDWAGSAAVAMPVTRIADLSGTTPGTASGLSDGTDINVAAEAVAGLPESTCGVALVLLTDGESDPLRAASAEALARAGVTSVMTIVPSGASLPSSWTDDFPYGDVRTAYADDVDGNAKAIAEAISLATGQRLVSR